MSRILKRPMFRDGGTTNSKGTGIMSGIEDREEYQYGGRTGGAPVISTDNKTILDIIASGGGGNVGLRGRTGVSPYIQPNVAYGGQSLADVLGYEPTDKPYQGQPSFRSMNTPDVYTPPPKEEEVTTTVTTTEDLEEPKKKEPEKDLETTLKEKATLYEKLLLGEDAKKQSIFKALTAAAPALLEEDYGAAIKAAGEELAAPEDVKSKAKVLAIEEQIKKDLVKNPAKQEEIQFLVDKGMSFADAVKAVYGGDKSSLLSAYSPERFLQDRINEYGKSDSKFVRDNKTGYAMGDAIQYQHPDIEIMSFQNNDPGQPLVQPGKIYWNPARRNYYVELGDGQASEFSSYEQAFGFLNK